MGWFQPPTLVTIVPIQEKHPTEKQLQTPQKNTQRLEPRPATLAVPWMVDPLKQR